MIGDFEKLFHVCYFGIKKEGMMEMTLFFLKYYIVINSMHFIYSLDYSFYLQGMAWKIDT